MCKEGADVVALVMKSVSAPLASMPPAKQVSLGDLWLPQSSSSGVTTSKDHGAGGDPAELAQHVSSENRKSPVGG